VGALKKEPPREAAKDKKKKVPCKREKFQNGGDPKHNVNEANKKRKQFPSGGFPLRKQPPGSKKHEKNVAEETMEAKKDWWRKIRGSKGS